MNDEAAFVRQNKRLLIRRGWIGTTLALAITIVLGLSLSAANIPVPGNNRVYLWGAGLLISGLLAVRWIRLGALAPKSAAALAWGQEVQRQWRRNISFTASFSLCAALVCFFLPRALPGVVIGALATSFMVMRAPPSWVVAGAIVEDEFVRAMRASALALGFLFMLASMVLLACLSVVWPDWLERAIALALAIPVAAMGWRFVLLTQSSGRDA